VVVGGGLAVAVYGLLQCLAVEAGAPTRISLDEIVRVHGSLTRFDIHLANLGVERLKRGRRAGIVAIGLLGVAAPSSWWAEEEPRPPTKPVVAVEAGEETICGTLASADNGHVIVQVDGEEKPRVINFDALDNLRVATTCP
jgi:hypothetical protein